MPGQRGRQGPFWVVALLGGVGSTAAVLASVLLWFARSAEPALTASQVERVADGSSVEVFLLVTSLQPDGSLTGVVLDRMPDGHFNRTTKMLRVEWHSNAASGQEQWRGLRERSVLRVAGTIMRDTLAANRVAPVTGQVDVH